MSLFSGYSSLIPDHKAFHVFKNDLAPLANKRLKT